jgi:hypothetical protein
MQTLAQANIMNIDELAQESVGRIQLLLSKSPAQAKKLIQEARRFPRFSVSVKEVDYVVIDKKGVESTFEILVEPRRPRKEVKKLLLKDAHNRAYHLAALTTTTDAQVSVQA